MAHPDVLYRLGDLVAQQEPPRPEAVAHFEAAVEIDPDHATAAKFKSELEARGVRCFDVGPQAIRLVTHLDVNAAQIEQACQIIRQVASLRLAETA